MTKPDILVVWTTRPTKIAEIDGEFHLHRYDQADDPDALLAEVGPRIRGVATTGGKGLTRGMVERMPRLEIVASSGVGYDKIDVDACTDHGAVVTNTPDVLTDDVADIALGLVINARRNMVAGDAYVRSGRWGQEGPLGLTSALRGKRLGILGLGRIGNAIAARAEPFGLEIGYMARSDKCVGYRYHSSLVALAEWADILVVAVPGGEGTDRLVDARVIAALGPAGTLVNISRGSVVDEAALTSALASGALASAGLDVFLNEPNPDPALTALPNVVLYPHHASGTVETRDAMAALVNDNLRAHFTGQPLLTPVNVPKAATGA